MDTAQELNAILDEVLSLEGRASSFTDSTPLLGAIPELDSMAVVALITTLEDRFGIAVDDDDRLQHLAFQAARDELDDDEIDGSTFATVGSLTAFVRGKLDH